jgi:hypothetical protein
LQGPSASDQQYDTIDRLDGPVPVAVNFPLDLHPGWNDVTFGFRQRSGERFDLGSDVISAAIAPDLTFERIGTAAASQAPVFDPAFAAVSVAKPPAKLNGDPELIGNLSGTATAGAILAIALQHAGSVDYRLFPIPRDGPFDINFMHAFPNDWNDVSQRLLGVWFLTRTKDAKFTDLYYDLHAMPDRALRNPQSLANLPLRIDGRLAGAGPIFLTRGRHVVTSGDPQLKIGLLTLAPTTLPRTRDFGLVWQRRAPTAVTVTTKSTATPFLLVFNEAFHPEWRATLRGVVLPHVIVNGVANGWIVPSLPAGGQIELVFAGQQYYVIAGAISVIALIIMIVLAWAPDLWPISPTNP